MQNHNMYTTGVSGTSAASPVANTEVTPLLVRNVLRTRWDSIPQDVKDHGVRSLYNWLGVTIGAARHDSVDMVLEVARAMDSSAQVSILGRTEKLDLLHAVLVNGMSSHIFDYDDTHLDTIHHPSGPVAPVVFALGEHYGFSGSELLHAFILGVEAELRISNAIRPSHYDIGWHVTSTTGVFGAAIAACLLLQSSEEEMLYALGIAGTQAFGLREMFGTMTKPFHPGKAAQNGLLAALLAKRGFTSSKQVLEAKRGFAHVLSPESDLSQVNVNWGSNWEILKNAFKPYACGIVLHPSIDACIALREFASPAEVDEIHIITNPYVLELTSKINPQTGLEGKFSIYHTASIAFMEGDAGQAQYEDEKVLSPEVVAFRSKIKTEIDPTMKEEMAKAVLTKKDGSQHEVMIEHATGSIENPMKNEDLIRKFTRLAAPMIGNAQVDTLTKYMYAFETRSLVNDILPLCRPN